MSDPTDPTDSPAKKRIETNRKRPAPEIQKRPPKAPGVPNYSASRGESPQEARRPRKDGQGPKGQGPKGQGPKGPGRKNNPSKPSRPDRSDQHRRPDREAGGPPGDRPHREPPKGGAQRGKGWSPANPDEPPPQRVGGARNEHGTRVARRVVCTRCGAHDHVQWVEQDNSTALCKVCAEEMLGVLELGRKEKQKTRDEICNLCGVPFAMPDHVEDDGDPLCGNCLRGFMAWQGTIDRTFEERQREVSTSVRPGLRVRRREGGAAPAVTNAPTPGTEDATTASPDAPVSDPVPEAPRPRSVPQEDELES